MPARVFLVDYHAHRKGEVLNLKSIEQWRKTFRDWTAITAPIGSRSASECGAAPKWPREDDRLDEPTIRRMG